MKLYTIKDNLVGFCNPPFQCQNDEAAKRLFVTLAKEPQPNVINTYPESKELWKLGEMDENTGALISDVVFLERALPYVQQVQVPFQKPQQKEERKQEENKQ